MGMNYDEIDLELEKEYPELFQKEKEDADEPEVIDMTDEEPDTTEIEEQDSSEEPAEPEVTEPTEPQPQVVPQTPSFDSEKANKAFAQLRKEKREAQETLETIAKLYDYKDVNAFTEAVKKAKLKKEAEAKGVDPKFYEEFDSIKRKMAETEEREQALVKQQKALNLKNSWSKVSQQYNLTPQDEATMYARLEEDGYTVEDVLNVRNYERLITGTLSDIILQRNSKPQKLQVDEGTIKATAPRDKSIDELLDAEMAEYAKKRGITF